MAGIPCFFRAAAGGEKTSGKGKKGLLFKGKAV
jgi:hypothetical protein